MSEISEEHMLRDAFRKRVPARPSTRGAIAVSGSDTVIRAHARRARVARWGARGAFLVLGSLLSLAIASEPRVMAQIERGIAILHPEAGAQVASAPAGSGTAAPQTPTAPAAPVSASTAVTPAQPVEFAGAQDVAATSEKKGWFGFSGKSGPGDPDFKPPVRTMPTSKLPVRRGE